MERKQVDLLFKVLDLLEKKGVLRHLVIAGSWCLYFYKFYYNKRRAIVSLRTRDVDFLLPDPKSITREVNLPDLLKDLGFITDHRGEQGYIRLVHPTIFIEFLVPEKGKGSHKAFPLPKLGLNAQTLRFMDILYMKTIIVKVRDVKIRLPHPACFLLHKIIVFERRREKDKKLKDKEQIGRMLDFLKNEKKLHSLKIIFTALHPKWQRRVITSLKDLGKEEIIDILL
ncbi:hypothetical protein BMS3Abin10_00333 [bacterium BMS3Abin10]|nr:hypothetical protein BMS3Abin10_00333 [bacterium BMS3Abin10]GBE40118.1 hypothetical protein BMS3Bbin08_02756 [bacterium BMS3Bbin08]